ncbi:MAG TPA: DUF4159 domain-containing protein [Stellaceae bacterium]|nr:DUF4159 domain-containing protein [Stellaceae bacterium]
MLSLGSLAFASPWLLAALVALPVIWWLLRVTPPAPRRIPFPALRLLLGLSPREETPARTPLWLIILRTILAALIIVGLAHPLINPQTRLAGNGPVILVIDDGWASAQDWTARQKAAFDLLSQAEREDRQIVLLTTAPLAADRPAPPLQPTRAADARAAVQALTPKPWLVDRKAALARLNALPLSDGTSAIWLSDDVDDGDAAGFTKALSERGSYRYLAAASEEAPRLIAPGGAPGGAPGERAGKELSVAIRTLPAPVPRPVTVRASAENGALLGRKTATIAPGDSNTLVKLTMPSELRNRIARIDIEGEESAGATLLVDEQWRRRPVGIAASANPSNQPLLSENYYLERALDPFTEIRRGPATELLKRELAVLVYSDAGPDSPVEEDTVRKWVEAGGVLLRFAGPHLVEQEDHLLPVRLRRGDRTIGGALSWEQPAKLSPFAAESPFAGLAIPSDVTVSRQVLAEPDIDLASKTWARLADGTPLVTAEKQGKGWIVLIHTTANAEWSNLALSGLFVEMLRRIVAVSEGVAEAGDAALPPLETLDGFGRLQRAPPTAQAISEKELATAVVSPRHPPGFYGTADTRRALNLASSVGELKQIGALPAGVIREPFARKVEMDIRPPLLVTALIVTLVDLLIAYVLRGVFRLPTKRASRGVAALVLAVLLTPVAARADDDFVIRATSELRFAYVRTGDDAVDAESHDGLVGLNLTLNRRTAVETAEPMAVDIESDELIFFPLLYWPVTGRQAAPSPQAVERINRYLATGGTVLFDTRDSGDSTPGPFGSGAQSAERLKTLIAGVKIPPLVPTPPDHVLTKSFYLMHEFPGRWNNGQVWVEPAEDRVNDGVSSVIVGGNDWAGAWAIDGEGHPEFPCVPGGEQQREMANRFGVNLVMYVLTGNYKSDQVHVPAILERLGQ